jgi:hypothetical protein
LVTRTVSKLKRVGVYRNPFTIRADVRRKLSGSGDFHVNQLSMTARRDENALSHAVRRVSGSQATDRRH